MPSFKRVGMMYGKNSDMALHLEFHYEPIFT